MATFWERNRNSKLNSNIWWLNLSAHALSFFLGSSVLYLTCSYACVCYACITYEDVAEIVENDLCLQLYPPLSLPQICSYFQTPKIFSLSLDRAKCSPLGSIILSHPAKAVALGGSVKNFISNHRYICLLSVVLGFSSLLWKLQYFIPNFTWFYAVLLGCLISKCHFSGFFFS